MQITISMQRTLKPHLSHNFILQIQCFLYPFISGLAQHQSPFLQQLLGKNLEVL